MGGVAGFTGCLLSHCGFSFTQLWANGVDFTCFTTRGQELLKFACAKCTFVCQGLLSSLVLGLLCHRLTSQVVPSCFLPWDFVTIQQWPWPGTLALLLDSC